MDEMFKDPEVLRTIILDNYQYPQNKSLSNEEGYHKVHMTSDSCIDDIYVQAKIANDKIEDIRFDGTACAIGTSSTTIMTQLIKGKTIEEAKKIEEEYYKMLDGKPYDEDLLKEAVAFQNVYKQPNRVHCASIGWHGLDRLLKGEEDD